MAFSALLHPVRLRIVHALLGDECTTSELHKKLPDIPLATLYRHIAALRDAGVVDVADEMRIRGTIERRYRLRTADVLMGTGTMTEEDHRVAFSVFTSTLNADLERYLSAPGTVPDEDGLVYRQAAVWLTADEHAELLRSITHSVKQRAEPGPGRKRHIISLVDIPADGA